MKPPGLLSQLFEMVALPESRKQKLVFLPHKPLHQKFEEVLLAARQKQIAEKPGVSIALISRVLSVKAAEISITAGAGTVCLNGTLVVRTSTHP